MHNLDGLAYLIVFWVFTISSGVGFGVFLGSLWARRGGK